MGNHSVLFDQQKSILHGRFIICPKLVNLSNRISTKWKSAFKPLRKNRYSQQKVISSEKKISETKHKKGNKKVQWMWHPITSTDHKSKTISNCFTKSVLKIFKNSLKTQENLAENSFTISIDNSDDLWITFVSKSVKKLEFSAWNCVFA